MNDLQNNNLDDFITNYRNSLQEQYDAGAKSLEQQRKNDQTTIMSNANTAGALYSNFPTRDKIKYDTNTYLPGLVNLRTTYQTGLDKLRSNALSVANNIKSIQAAIDNLNSMYN